MNKKGREQIKKENWEELNDILDNRGRLFNLQNKKNKGTLVQFFPHQDEITICISSVPEWEIALKKDGTWSLE